MGEELEEKDVVHGGPEDGFPLEEPDKGKGPGETGQVEVLPGEGEEAEGEEGKVKESPTYKFKSWDQAEKSADEAHRTVTRLSMEISDLKKRLEGFDKAKGPSPEDEIEKKTKEIQQNALREIRELPYKYEVNEKGEKVPVLNDPDREAQAYSIHMKAVREVARMEREEGEKKKKGESDLRTYVEGKLEQAGFKEEKEKDLFWSYFMPKLPSYLQNAPLDDAIKWGVDQLTGFMADLTERISRGKDEDEEEKKRLSVQGGGSRVPKPGKGKGAEDTTPSTMAEAMKQLRREQTYKGG